MTLKGSSAQPPRTDPAACTNNISNPALRSKKLHETIDAKKQQVLEMLDTIYLLSVEVAACDAEMQKVKRDVRRR